MIAPHLASYLRHTSPELLLANHAGFAQNRFDQARQSEDPARVVIAAMMEQHDIVATLLSLSRSETPVDPIVVVNGSDDATAERAAMLGARTHTLAEAGKMAALQAGVEIALDGTEQGSVLFTDADTLVGCKWAASMRRHLRGSQATDPAFISSSGVVWHGKAKSADTLHSFHQVVGHARVASRGARPGARGYNMAVDFTPDLYKQYMSMDPKLFGGEDSAVRDLVMDMGGRLVATTHPHSIVLTRGDRFESARDYRRWWKDPSSRHSFYPEIQAYGLVPYTPAKVKQPASH